MTTTSAIELESNPTSVPPGQLPRWTRSWTWLVTPALLFLLVFFVYPVYEMFAKSVSEVTAPYEGFWGNYLWVFTSEVQLTILLRTMLVAVLVTVSCLALGFPFAYLMTVVSAKWRLVLLGAVLMPFWTSMVVRTYSWVVLFQDSGPIISSLNALGMEGVRLLGTTTAVMIGSAQVLLPFMILPLYSSLAKIDRTLLTAASSLGASPRVAFWKVYAPLSIPGVLAGSTIVFILSLGFYFTPALLGSPQNSLMSQQIVEQVNGLLAFGRGGTQAVVLFVMTLLVLGAGAALLRFVAGASGRGRSSK